MPNTCSGDLMAMPRRAPVELKTGEKLAPGIPRGLFQAKMLYGDLSGDRDCYSPSGDGRKFLISSSVEDYNQTLVVVRLTWMKPLRSKDARGK